MSNAHSLKNHASKPTSPVRTGAAFRWNIWAFLALIFASAVVTVVLLATASDELDAYEVKKTSALAETAVAQATKHLQTIARDYGHWDDMVNKLVVDYDKEWTANNITDTLTENFGISASFVVDGEGQLINAYCPPSICAETETLNGTKIERHFGGGIDEVLKQAREKAVSNDLSGAQGVIAFKGGHYAFGIAPIMPLQESFPAYETEIMAGRATTFLLLIALDADYVAKIGQDYLLNDARLKPFGVETQTETNSGEVSLPLQASDGAVAATLHWKVDSPSAPFLKLIGIPVLAVSLCVIGLSFVFAYFLRRTAAQNTAARLRAEQADKTKTEFLANMSHELRTPLNAIVGFSQLIADEALGAVGHPNYKTFAQDIQKSGEHLTSLVSDILDITKLKAGTFTLKPQPIRLGPTIESVVRSMQQAASDGQITLTSNAASDIAVMADPTAAERALRNILSNAIKFTPKGGRVEISVLEAKDGMVGLAVKDNGIGIPPAKQAAIFEPFEQVDSSFVRAQQGPGLGLSIVKSLMEGQGGRVDLESEVGAGTTITLRFKQTEPLTVAASAEAKPARRSMMAAPKAEQAEHKRQAG